MPTMSTTPPRRWNHPGVTYPREEKPKRAPLPAGCPKYVATLGLFAPWVKAAGLWATVPSRSTMQRWKKAGLIVTKHGATGVPLIDCGASLQRLTPSSPY